MDVIPAEAPVILNRGPRINGMGEHGSSRRRVLNTTSADLHHRLRDEQRVQAVKPSSLPDFEELHPANGGPRHSSNPARRPNVPNVNHKVTTSNPLVVAPGIGTREEPLPTRSHFIEATIRLRSVAEDNAAQAATLGFLSTRLEESRKRLQDLRNLAQTLRVRRQRMETAITYLGLHKGTWDMPDADTQGHEGDRDRRAPSPSPGIGRPPPRQQSRPSAKLGARPTALDLLGSSPQGPAEPQPSGEPLHFRGAPSPSPRRFSFEPARGSDNVMAAATSAAMGALRLPIPQVFFPPSKTTSPRGSKHSREDEVVKEASPAKRARISEHDRPAPEHASPIRTPHTAERHRFSSAVEHASPIRTPHTAERHRFSSAVEHASPVKRDRSAEPSSPASDEYQSYPTPRDTELASNEDLDEADETTVLSLLSPALTAIDEEELEEIVDDVAFLVDSDLARLPSPSTSDSMFD